MGGKGHSDAAMRAYVDADRKARQREALPDDLPKTWELSYQFDGECYGPGGWRVHNVVGYPNHREWQLVGAGATPSEAIRAAIAKGEQSHD